MTPLVVLGSVLLEPFLRIWAGAGIARSGAPVGEILLLGVWMNSLAIVPYALLQAKGRPDLTAKISVLELAPYIGALWLGLHFNGLNGAAWAWTARAGVDALLLFWVAGRGQSDALAHAQRRALLAGGAFAIVACISALTLFAHASVRISLGFLLVVTVLVWAWRLAPQRMRRLVPWPRT
jgi:O-antigen/teichoic acid export membrane protein